MIVKDDMGGRDDPRQGQPRRVRLLAVQHASRRLRRRRGPGATMASGMALATIGTDTGGSIIQPSALQGDAGLRPTMRLASRRGIVPISASQDTAGPITGTVEDAACVLQAIAQADPLDAPPGYFGPSSRSSRRCPPTSSTSRPARRTSPDGSACRASRRAPPSSCPPSVGQSYTSTLAVSVTGTAGDATLTAQDPARRRPGICSTAPTRSNGRSRCVPSTRRRRPRPSASSSRSGRARPCGPAPAARRSS